jgi:hypothetical protein
LGHLTAYDNLKRVLMRFCGDLMVLPVGRSLNRAWTDASEFAADEYAVGLGGKTSALNLASALIKIARVIPERPGHLLPAASFIVDGRGEALSDRVRRLLRLADDPGDVLTKISFANPKILLALVGLPVIVILALATDATFLSIVHSASEVLVSVLQ